MTLDQKDALVQLVQLTHGVLVRQNSKGCWFCNNGNCGAGNSDLNLIPHLPVCPVGIAVAEWSRPCNPDGW